MLALRKYFLWREFKPRINWASVAIHSIYALPSISGRPLEVSFLIELLCQSVKSAKRRYILVSTPPLPSFRLDALEAWLNISFCCEWAKHYSRATWRSKSRFNFILRALQAALNWGFVWRKLGAFSEVTESVICEAKTTWSVRLSLLMLGWLLSWNNRKYSAIRLRFSCKKFEVDFCKLIFRR